MYRFVWFVAGCVFSYLASGYIEGLLDEDEVPAEERNIAQNTGDSQ